MNQTDRAMIAAFVSQRMELGEEEWYVEPAVVNAALEDASPSVPSGAAAAVPHTTPETAMTSEPEMPREFDSSELQTKESLESLYDTVHDCRRCGLGETRTNFVFGEGDPHAGIMFVGEAPGQEEDQQGRPFVGRAGKLLTKMINAMKLDRGDVYIGNILKCRPPGNRDPKADEIEKCEPILLRQIELIQPKIICALGRISGQTLLRTKASLSSLRGTFHDYHGVKLLVTYHPAALLRNPNWKPRAWEDLKLIRREYDGLEL